MSYAYSPSDEAILHAQKHILYWKRCLKTFLPHYYTSNDCTRMTLGFFILSALDLLNQLHTTANSAERAEYADWIYSNQLPEGGFRGSPATDLRERRNESNSIWDPANIAATAFALLSLAVLGDDFKRIKRTECLAWLTRLQRPDGSFGETLNENGAIEGGTDTRYSYCATVIRRVLRSSIEEGVDDPPDINVDKLVDRIGQSQTYEGGISESPFHEAHAGFTYCATGTLSLLGRLPEAQQTAKHRDIHPGLIDHAQAVRFLVLRQTQILDESDISEEVDEDTEDVPGSKEADPPEYAEFLNPGPLCAGFSGRCNKIADTCYSYWVGGSLSLLGKFDLIDFSANRRYLLTKTQHIVGGFGKIPGDPPDVYHSYLGLASLAMMGEDGLKTFNAALCISEDATAHVESLPWRNTVRS